MQDATVAIGEAKFPAVLASSDAQRFARYSTVLDGDRQTALAAGDDLGARLEGCCERGTRVLPA
jgi:hypothetical protein